MGDRGSSQAPFGRSALYRDEPSIPRHRVNLLLVSGPDAGHALPIVGLAAALVERGHEVVIATGNDRRDAVESAGARFLGLPLVGPTTRDDDMGYRLWGRAAEMAPPLVELLEQKTAQLDGVIVDVLTRVGAYAAELLGLPWIELSPHHLMEPSAHLPPIGLGRSPHAPWWRRRDDARLRARQRESIAAGVTRAIDYRRAIGLPVEMAPPVARLLATLPSLEHPRPDWPDDAYVVGPLAADPPWPKLPPPPGDEPLVVVTDSTASGLDVSLAELAIDALSDLAVRLVITTGREPDAPTGVVVGRGPHGPLLEDAAVAVGPGGHGFVTKALAHGVPLVLIPLAGDQRETAARVPWAGVGRSMSPLWLRVPLLGARRLRWEVLRVLGDGRYREAAELAADETRQLGPAYAAQLVEELLGGQNSGRSAPRS